MPEIVIPAWVYSSYYSTLFSIALDVSMAAFLSPLPFRPTNIAVIGPDESRTLGARHPRPASRRLGASFLSTTPADSPPFLPLFPPSIPPAPYPFNSLFLSLTLSPLFMSEPNNALGMEQTNWQRSLYFVLLSLSPSSPYIPLVPLGNTNLGNLPVAYFETLKRHVCHT